MSEKRTILVVDDDPDVRESVMDALEQEGYNVVSAGNGLEAMQLLTDGLARPDLILLDMMMPVMDGWAFCAEQQKQPEFATIPVVVFTAYAVPRDTAVALHAADVLKKPLHFDELLDAIERHAGAANG